MAIILWIFQMEAVLILLTNQHLLILFMAQLVTPLPSNCRTQIWVAMHTLLQQQIRYIPLRTQTCGNWLPFHSKALLEIAKRTLPQVQQPKKVITTKSAGYCNQTTQAG